MKNDTLKFLILSIEAITATTDLPMKCEDHDMGDRPLFHDKKDEVYLQLIPDVDILGKVRCDIWARSDQGPTSLAASRACQLKHFMYAFFPEIE